MKIVPKVTCSVCGDVQLDSVTIYNESLRKQTFEISPILPTCNICGSEVEVLGDTRGVKVLLLNGTCGSGKSSTAKELVRTHGFLALDADCVAQVLKHKLGVQKYNVEVDSPEFLEEIAKEIDILSAVGRKIVVSTVLMPEGLQKYKEIFESRGIDYRYILLKPNYETAVARTQTRTCFGSVTPEEWVKYFYDRLVFDDAYTFDNSSLTVAQSAIAILQKVGF